jgi:hypothetical protein
MRTRQAESVPARTFILLDGETLHKVETDKKTIHTVLLPEVGHSECLKVTDRFRSLPVRRTGSGFAFLLNFHGHVA